MRLLRLFLFLLVPLALLRPPSAAPKDAAATGVPPVANAVDASRPNVVMILVDDLGYGDLGCYGAPDVRTPHIDRLAREGVRLTNGYASGPVCTPTRCGFITGRYQERAGLEWAIEEGQTQPGLSTAQPSIALLLQSRGYATAMFGKWHLGYRPECGPRAHGFDEFFGNLGGNLDEYSHRDSTGAPDLYEGNALTEQPGYLTDLLTQRATHFIARHAGASEPFFVYVAYNAVHWPFQPPGRPSDVRQPSTWYDGTRLDYVRMLERVDEGVGSILAALDRRGLAANTLVVLTSDNGGERLSRNAPFFHHKGTLWEGGIRVPVLMRWPARLPAGCESNQPAITMDLTATIAAACSEKEVRSPGRAATAFDGIDLVPILRGEQAAQERTFCWRIDRAGRRQKAVRMGTWKLVIDGDIEQLFDLSRDPGERTDLAYEHPEIVTGLRKALNAWERDVDRARPALVVK